MQVRSWKEICMPSLSLIVFLFAFAIPNLRATRLLQDPDTFLHIASGQWMLAHQALPFSDPFSFSMPGAHWPVHEWLAELLLALIYSSAGWGGLIVVTSACFAASATMLLRRLVVDGEPMTAVLAAICSGMLLEPHLLARPHMLALPIMVAWCIALTAARAGRRAPPFALIPLMILWSNLHGGFMVGLGLAVFFAVEAAVEHAPSWRKETKGWGIFIVAAVLASMVNPNGLTTLLEPIHLMRMGALHDSFTEWLSPNFHQFQPLEVWLLGLFLAGYGLGLKLPFLRAVFLTVLLHFGLQATRHGDLVAVLFPIVAWPAVGPQLRAVMEKGGSTMVASTFVALTRPSRFPALAIGAMLALLLAANPMLERLEPVNGPSTPVAAFAAAQAAGLGGPVFNSENFGGYMIFTGVPTLIDGRIEMYGGDYLSRYLRAYEGDESALKAFVDEYQIRWAVLEPQSGAALLLEHEPGWRRVFADQYAVIDERVAVNP
jgi:hypothetical protein